GPPTRATRPAPCTSPTAAAGAPATTRSCARSSRLPPSRKCHNEPGGATMSDRQYDVVGTRPVRHDGADKVTGRALYGADFDTAGLLHGYILRSPHAHARIL